MKLDLEFDGFTKLKNWWEQVKKNFKTIEDEGNALSQRIGENADLDTSHTDTVVGAINEAFKSAEDANTKICEFADSDELTSASKIQEALARERQERIDKDYNDVKYLLGHINAIDEAVNEVNTDIVSLNTDKADKIIATASGTDTVTITDADGVDMLVSGGTTLSKEPLPTGVAEILGVTSINVNGVAVNTEENPIYNSDTIDVATGKIRRKMAMYQFTGDENFNVISGMDNRFVNGGIFDYTQVVHPANNSTIANIYCTHFQTAPYAIVTSSSTFTDNVVGLIGGGYNHIAFSYSGAESADEFKSFLKQEYEKGTPVTVLYELVEGTEEDIDVSDVSLVKGENEISVYGENNIRCSLPLEIPEPYFAQGDEYEGDRLTIDVTINGFFYNGFSVGGEEKWSVALDTHQTNYVVATFDTKDNSFGGLTVADSFVESTFDDGVWRFTIYEYSNFNCEFKVSSDSPTGDLYIFDNCSKVYSQENADETESTYTIEKRFKNGRAYDFNLEYSADTKLYIDKKFSELQNAILATGGNV